MGAVNATTDGARYDWLTRKAGAAPLVVAHRGASGQAPENTLAAFRLAIDQGAAAVECDVQLSADGVPVVIHDGSVDRTTDGRGAVGELRWTSCGAGRRRRARRALRRRAHPHPGGDARRLRRPGAPVHGAEAPGGLGERAGRAGAGAGRPGGAGAGAAALLELAVISFDPEIVAWSARTRPDLPLGFLVSAQRVTRSGQEAILEETAALGAGSSPPGQRRLRSASSPPPAWPGSRSASRRSTTRTSCAPSPPPGWTPSRPTGRTWPWPSTSAPAETPGRGERQGRRESRAPMGV